MSDAVDESGSVPINLDGQEMLLSPSLGACIAVSGIAGGLNAAVQRCLALEMDTICKVIVAGLGLNPVMAKTVPELVYKTGLMSLSAPCIDFINVIGNGGRPVSYEDEDDAPDPQKPASP